MAGSWVKVTPGAIRARGHEYQAGLQAAGFPHTRGPLGFLLVPGDDGHVDRPRAEGLDASRRPQAGQDLGRHGRIFGQQAVADLLGQRQADAGAADPDDLVGGDGRRKKNRGGERRPSQNSATACCRHDRPTPGRSNCGRYPQIDHRTTLQQRPKSSAPKG